MSESEAYFVNIVRVFLSLVIFAKPSLDVWQCSEYASENVTDNISMKNKIVVFMKQGLSDLEEWGEII